MRPAGWLKVVAAASMATALVLSATASAAAANLVVRAPSVQCPDARPLLQGSFLQPPLAEGWGQPQWRRELGLMRQTGQDQLILQWSADSSTMVAEYPTNLPGFASTSGVDVIGQALMAADAEHVKVLVGLQLNDNFFGSSGLDPAWMAQQARLSRSLAADLFARYGRHPSFAGWYLPFEVDNDRFLTRKDWDVLVHYYQSVGAELRRTNPALPVVVAPFFNASGTQSPVQWREMLTYILRRSPVDVVALQDGVGVGHALATDLPRWFAATRAATLAAGHRVQLWDDVETFTGSSGPKDIRDVVTDMKAVQPYVSRFVSFSFNHYISPQQGFGPWYDAYSRYADCGHLDAEPPMVPPGIGAVLAGGATNVTLSWGQSSDDVGVAGYLVYRDGTLVGRTDAGTTTFDDPELVPLTTFSYRVRARDGTGNVSEPSDQAVVTTGPEPTFAHDFALGAPYVISGTADPSYPDSGLELTDGIHASSDFGDPAWQGRADGQSLIVTVDLGAVRPLGQFDSTWLFDPGPAIDLPKSVSYSVSSDGTSFTNVGVRSAPVVSAGPVTVHYRLTLTAPVSARFVRLLVAPGDGWLFMDEVAAWGN